MNIRLLALKIHIPLFIKKKKLEELSDIVADAFGKPKPTMKGLSYDERLKAFASFTAKEAQMLFREEQHLEEVRTKLYEKAHKLGQKIRKDFRIRSTQEIMEMSRILYQILGIDFEGDRGGDVTIKKCFFSHYYSNRVCDLISSLDEGVAAGLSEGGKLSFFQKITEGKDCCKAYFVVPEEKN
jgi:hypothetical protein